MDTVWWKMSPAEVAADPEALEARRIAYFNTLYGHDEGRQVLLDIMEMCYAGDVDPAATLALIKLFNELRARAGIDKDAEKAAIDAEAAAIK